VTRRNIGGNTVSRCFKGTDPVGGTPKEFSDFIRADIEKWTAILASSSPRK